VSPVRPARFHLAFGLLSFLLGFALILGGPTRSAAYAYSVITQQGGVYVWGTAFVVLGIGTMMSGDYPKVLEAFLLLGCCAYWLLSAAFCVAAVFHEEANLTAMVAYGWISVLHWCAFTKVRRDHPSKR